MPAPYDPNDDFDLRMMEIRTGLTRAPLPPNLLAGIVAIHHEETRAALARQRDRIMKDANSQRLERRPYPPTKPGVASDRRRHP